MLIATAQTQTSMASKDTFEDLDLSQEEIKRIGEALKDEKFRKMFVEYAEEISNPENRKRYEEEIAMMENERGMNVEFVNPQPGHVLKTTVDGNKKAFINICINDKIGKPNAKKHTNEEGKNGLYWQIPHSFSPPREDVDKEHKKCTVYDVVFHPDTYRMSDNPKFKKMVEDTALDGIERQFECKLDRQNIRRPKLKYKGSPVATVIRSRNDGNSDNTSTNKEASDVLKNMPYPYGNLTSQELANKNAEELKKKEEEKKTKANKTKSNIEKKEEIGYTTPKYTIIHRSDLDIQEFRNAPDAKQSTRPKDLVVSIELPLCKSAIGVALDIFEDKLSLKSEKPAYKLDIKLPYQVDDEVGTAKFDKTRKLLIVTLPVLPGEELQMPSFIESKDSTTESSETTGNGLIEELPPLEEIKAQTIPNDLPPLEDIGNELETQENSHKPTHMVAYALPEFDFSQDSQTVTFIFHVRNVEEDSVSKTFPEAGVFRIRFFSCGSGGFPMHYSFCAKFEADPFEESYGLVPEYCTVDVSERNVSVLLLKAKENRYLWNRFMAGLDEETDLEEKLFLTENNLQSQLDQLTAESENMGQTGEQTAEEQHKVEVTEMSSKKLHINIEKLPSKFSIPEEDEEEYDADECPSSADIEVVHSKQSPPLHGILKQRSISENSEDYQSSSSESPTGTSPREIDGQKRGVHFNSHVDKTTFKSNLSVSSMKVTLKSKRRRNRKREERKKDKCSRRRHNSTGSECSSCDEVEAKASSESLSEEENGDLGAQIDETGKKVTENGVIVEEEIVEKQAAMEDHDAIPLEENVEEELGKSKHFVENPGEKKNDDQNEGIKTKMTKGSKLVQDVKKKLSEKSEAVVGADSDDDDADESGRTSKHADDSVEIGDTYSQKDVDRTSWSNEAVVNDLIQKCSITAEGTDPTGNGEAANLTDDNSGTNSAILEQNKGIGEPEGLQTDSQHPLDVDFLSEDLVDPDKLEDGMHEKGDGLTESEGEKVTKAGVNGETECLNKSSDVSETETEQGAKDGGKQEKESGDSKNVVETELSWKEPNRAAPNNEHRSECAFKFSNALMFDLDFD